MNAYANLAQIKSPGWLNIPSTQYDIDLLRIAEDMSRDIDTLTNTFFYCYEGIRYYDGTAVTIFFNDDILSVSSLACDWDGSKSYASAYLPTDYILYPLNKYPKRFAKVATVSNYPGFANNIRSGVKVTGVFGYADTPIPYVSSGDSVQNDPLSDSDTKLSVTIGGNFSAGQTLRIGSEQCYVLVAVGNDLTIIRNCNGTTAASHAKNTKIYIYQYFGPIVEATLIQLTRIWERRKSGFQDAVVTPGFSQLLVYKGLDDDVKLRIQRVMRRTF